MSTSTAASVVNLLGFITAIVLRRHCRGLTLDDINGLHGTNLLSSYRDATKAQCKIASCEASSETAEIPFDWIRDKMTGADQKVTDYVLERTDQKRANRDNE
jgi:hypothetical protein